jgi:hypothetical protein
MRCLIWRRTAHNEPIIDNRDDNDAATNADETGEQSSASTGYSTQDE